MLQGTRQPSDFEVGWAAGLFEGEGCISRSFTSRDRWTRQLQLSMNDRDVVDRFHAVVGCGKVHQRGPLSCWSVYNWKGIEATLLLLLPHLGERRSVKAREMLDNPPRQDNVPMTHCKRGHPMEGENVYLHAKSGKRQCRECNRLRSKARYRREVFG